MSEGNSNGLIDLGYTPIEADFLRLVALHAGVFLRRHWVAYYGQTANRQFDILVDRLLTKRHGAVELHDALNRRRYHVTSRAIYSVLDPGDSRQRKRGSASRAVARMMALDFVLAHRQHAYLATEREKVAYFVGQHGVSREVLPAKVYGLGAATTTRHFVDRSPVYLEGSAESPTAVGFTFIDEGSVSFARHLLEYRGLFQALQTPARLTFVSPSKRRFEGARRMLEETLRPSSAQEELGRFFRLRVIGDRFQFAGFNAADYAQYRAGKRRFSDARHEALYRAFLEGEGRGVTPDNFRQLPLFDSVPEPTSAVDFRFFRTES